MNTPNAIDSIKQFAQLLFLRPRRFFVFIFVLCGLPLILLIPPFQAPDEDAHFYRAYQISEGQFLAAKLSEGAGGRLPASLELSHKIARSAFDPKVPNSNYDFVAKTREQVSIPLNPEVRKPLVFSGSAIYSPVAYIPQAVGIALGRLFNAPPVLLLYLGRICNALAFLLLALLALRFIPVGKWLMGFVLLLPMSLFLVASQSADALTLGVVSFFVALVTYAARRSDPLPKRYWLMLGATVVGLALCKQAFFVLLPLIFAMLLTKDLTPSERKRRLLRNIAILAMAGAAVLLWLYLTKHISVLKGDPINATQQLSFIMHHPRAYGVVVWQTFAEFGANYLEGFIGILGWLDVYLPDWLVIAFWLVLVASLGIDRLEQKSLNRGQKVIFGSVASAQVLVIITALYLSWTPVTNPVVLGVQGRYFLPVGLTLVPAVAGSLRWRLPLWLINASFLLLSVITLLVILKTYY